MSHSQEDGTDNHDVVVPAGSESPLEAFMAIYDGYDKAYGSFRINSSAETGKVKGIATTIRTPAGKAAWISHLRGGEGLGIVPLRADNTCRFAAIDIDKYNLDIHALELKIKKLGIPLVPCRSKSGGAHLYLYLRTPVLASTVVTALVTFAGALGFEGSEIFPKQTYREAPDDVGNWINLPYFNGSKTERYAIHNGASLSPLEFIRLAQDMQVTEEDLLSTTARISSFTTVVDSKGDEKVVAPVTAGRNDYLFRIACDLFKAGITEDLVATSIASFNNTNNENHPHFLEKGPLEAAEVGELIKSAKKHAAKRKKKKRASTDVQQVMEEMNRQYAVTMVGGVALIMSHKLDHKGRKTIEFIKKDDLAIILQNRFVTVRTSRGGVENFVREPLLKFWLSHPDRREYKSVIFAPAQDVPGHYNLWTGWAVEPKTEVTGARFIDHLHNVICAGNEKHFEWVLAWLADLVQRPDKRPGTALVLRGGEGAGKGSFVQYVAQIVGQHFVHVLNNEHFVGRFNSHMQSAILVYLDEAFFAGDRRQEGMLKGLITEEVILLEAKYRNATPVANFIRVIMASNSSWTIPAGLDARRFMVLDVSNARRGDAAYFLELSKEMESTGPSALLQMLLGHKYDGINLRNPPHTEALIDQKHLTMSAEEGFWFERLQDGVLTPSPLRPEHDAQQEDEWREPTDSGRLWLSTRSVYAAYKEYCDDRNNRYTRSEGLFGKALKELCPGIVRKKRWTNHVVQTIDGAIEERAFTYCYGFPPLADCRKQLEEKFGHLLDWQPAEDNEYPEPPPF